MDLLIEAIVWLFRTLFGEQEPQAKVGPRRDSTTSSGGRGPYNYGDGRAQGPRPKTLAELLEEARTQQQGGTPQQQQQQRTEVVPAAEPTRPQPQPQPQPQQRAPAPPPAQPRPRPQPVAVAPQPDVAEAEQKRKRKQARKRKKKRAAQEAAAQAPSLYVEQPDAHGFRQSEHDMHDFKEADYDLHGFRKAGVAVRRSEVSKHLAEWLADLKKGRSKAKTLAGAQALAAIEVLGQPRCHRPFRFGRPRGPHAI